MKMLLTIMFCTLVMVTELGLLCATIAIREVEHYYEEIGEDKEKH